jgi:hypothetical protein
LSKVEGNSHPFGNSLKLQYIEEDSQRRFSRRTPRQRYSSENLLKKAAWQCGSVRGFVRIILTNLIQFTWTWSRLGGGVAPKLRLPMRHAGTHRITFPATLTSKPLTGSLNQSTSPKSLLLSTLRGSLGLDFKFLDFSRDANPLSI